MKYIKRFEKYVSENVMANADNTSIDDEIGGPDEATFDHKDSPVLRQKVQEYVAQILHSNDNKIIFDALGIKQPDDVEGSELDSMYDEVEKKAIEYFIKHPHKMIDPDQNDVQQNTMGIVGNPQNNPNDRIPKITN